MQGRLLQDQREIGNELKAFQTFSTDLAKGKLRAEEEFETLAAELAKLKEHQVRQREQLYEALERTQPDNQRQVHNSKKSDNVLKVINDWNSNKFYGRRDGPLAAHPSQQVSDRNSHAEAPRVGRHKKINELIHDIEDILDR